MIESGRCSAPISRSCAFLSHSAFRRGHVKNAPVPRKQEYNIGKPLESLLGALGFLTGLDETLQLTAIQDYIGSKAGSTH
jgi:hypothetical protein